MFLRRRGSKEASSETSDLGINEKALDKRVTKAQTKAEKQNRQAVKLLILGGGGSGKTTLRKQFSRLYAHAFRDAKVRVDLKDVILHNLLEGMKLTITAAEQYAGGVKTPEAQAACAEIKALADDPVKLTDQIVAAFRVLHEDPVIK